MNSNDSNDWSCGWSSWGAVSKSASRLQCAYSYLGILPRKGAKFDSAKHSRGTCQREELSVYEPTWARCQCHLIDTIFVASNLIFTAWLLSSRSCRGWTRGKIFFLFLGFGQGRVSVRLILLVGELCLGLRSVVNLIQSAQYRLLRLFHISKSFIGFPGRSCVPSLDVGNSLILFSNWAVQTTIIRVTNVSNLVVLSERQVTNIVYPEVLRPFQNVYFDSMEWTIVKCGISCFHDQVQFSTKSIMTLKIS